ncbi:hypothetical protein [Halovivax limisalsi]|uniref:hypothetical protein n=1 Tax=Halovivax limisalsi TaxID=1453760 RepID=UPI001FFCB582|nr:hypothetical protein [Halovivax limisalsi]
MTELEIPSEADAQRAQSLLEDFVDVGAAVEVRSGTRTDTVGETPTDVRGTITAFEHGYLELDGDSPESTSVRYDEIDLVTRLDTADR